MPLEVVYIFSTIEWAGGDGESYQLIKILNWNVLKVVCNITIGAMAVFLATQVL